MTPLEVTPKQNQHSTVMPNIMKDAILILLGAFITFIATIFYRFIDSRKKIYEDKNKIINDICYTLIRLKQVFEINQIKWVESHNYHRAQKETEETIIEDLYLSNKNQYEISCETINELIAKFELLYSEYRQLYPKYKWFKKLYNQISNTNLEISYDEYKKVNTLEELKIAHSNYTKFINSRLENEINPPIDKLIKKLRKMQRREKNRMNFMIKYWA